MSKIVCIPAAAVMLLFNGAGTAYSWYPEECSHDKDCHPVPCQEIAKAHQDMGASCSQPRI
jgi:hypothetical protein